MLAEGRLRSYIADRAGISAGDDFAMLWVTGTDLPGAATIVDPAGRPVPPRALRASSSDPDGEPLFRFSLAGVQLKFSAIEAARGGLTIPVDAEDGQWIVKLPSPNYRGVPENEFAMMTLAAPCGFEVPEIRLVAVDAIEGLPAEVERLDGNALAIRRFDRGREGERIHIEDLCQAFRVQPDEKYRARSFVDAPSDLDGSRRRTARGIRPSLDLWDRNCQHGHAPEELVVDLSRSEPAPAVPGL